MSKQLETIKKIGEDIGMEDLLEKIMRIGKKRTEQLDGAGMSSKQKIMKTEDGVEYPERCYAYVPDSEQVSTWKLRMCDEDLEITREQLGRAAAAFSEGGFRGQRVELPQADIGKVKRRIRAEYEKLGVEREDMPEGIKSMEVVMDELKEKLAEKVKAYSGAMREKMDAVLSDMEKAESDQVALVRQLAEMIAQVENEELRVGLEEIVNAMQEILMPEEDDAEELVEDKEEAESKEVDLVEEFQLDKLSEMLEEHNKAITSNSEKLESVKALVDAIEELVNKNKALFEKVEALEDEVKQLAEKSAEVEEKAKELERQDEEKIAEKQARFVPFWASSYQASKASDTVLEKDEERKFAKPEVPAPIQALTNSYLRRK